MNPGIHALVRFATLRKAVPSLSPVPVLGKNRRPVSSDRRTSWSPQKSGPSKWGMLGPMEVCLVPELSKARQERAYPHVAQCSVRFRTVPGRNWLCWERPSADVVKPKLCELTSTSAVPDSGWGLSSFSKEARQRKPGHVTNLWHKPC